MSKGVKTLRMDSRLGTALEDAADDRGETQADTSRKAVELGLIEMGYLPEEQTTIEAVTGELTRFSMYAALVVLALALATRMNGLFSAGTALFLIGMFSYAVETNEPEITQRIRRFQA